MSLTSLTSIKNPNDGAITLGGNINSPGMIIQTAVVRTDARTTYSSAASGNGTTITDLNLTITPKFSTSLLVMQWMINCEIPAGWDNVFLIHKDGALITTAGYEGYNSQGGNNRWSGVMVGNYDNNNDSTMGNHFLQYAIPASSTVSQTFAPAIRSASATAYTLYLNRTVGSTGQDNYEVTVSSGVIWEVAQ